MASGKERSSGHYLRGPQHAAQDVPQVRPLSAVPDSSVPDLIRAHHPRDGESAQGRTPDRSLQPQPVSRPCPGVHGRAAAHAVDGQKAALRLPLPQVLRVHRVLPRRPRGRGPGWVTGGPRLSGGGLGARDLPGGYPSRLRLGAGGQERGRNARGAQRRPRPARLRCETARSRRPPERREARDLCRRAEEGGPVLTRRPSLPGGGRRNPARYLRPARGAHPADDETVSRLPGLPVVAVVGAPNVGKSSLVNRILRGRGAVVSDQPGTTRDRAYNRAEWAGHEFTLVDTGGMEPRAKVGLETLVTIQAKVAVEEADVILHLTDSRLGVTEADAAIARELRRLSIVGRPNVGKSTLLNRLLGADRAVVSEVAGTTTDAVADTIEVEVNGETERYLVMDTAGLSRGARRASGVPYYSSLRTSEAIRRSDVSLLLVDAVQGLVGEDLRIAREIEEAGGSCGVVVNKRDLVSAERLREIEDAVFARLTDLKPKTIHISALTGAGVEEVLPFVARIGRAYRLRVPTHEVAEFVNDLVDRSAP